MPPRALVVPVSPFLEASGCDPGGRSMSNVPRVERRAGLVRGAGRVSAILSVCLLSAATCRAADLRPSWECLPAETVFTMRLPDPAAFVEAARQRTRFGAVMLAPERLQRVWEAFLPQLAPGDGAESDAEAAAARLAEGLGRYGLTTADLSAVLAGEVGLGVVLLPHADGRPTVPLVMAWTDPGAEAAGRLLTAVKQVAEEGTVEGPEPMRARRVDLTLAGHEVLWVAQPLMRTAEPAPDALGHMFCTVIGGRLLLGQSLPLVDPVGTNDEDDGGKAAGATPAQPRDIEAESRGEEARDIFERFLAAHATTDEPPLMAALQTRGLREALPEGITLLDVMVDAGGLLRRFGAGAAGAAEALAATGVDGLGPVAWRHTLDGDVYRQGLFVALPAPRSGLMQILEQEVDAAEVPSFVTSDAMGLTQISLDLGRAYRTFREIAVAQGGEQAANMFTAEDMQSQGWLGLDLPGVLTALGSRHWIVAYPPKVAEKLVAARQDGRPLESMPDLDRMAIVWQVSDEAPFAKFVQRLAPLARAEIVEEQGFRGFRPPTGPAVFLGQRHLVVAIGDDALEKTLAAIRTPPTGAASLREGAAIGRAAAILPPTPARMFFIGDSTSTGGQLGLMRELLSVLEDRDIAPPARDLVARLRPLLPSAAEMEGMFGVSTALLETTDAGITYRSAWELPRP